jgi:hypothetical protein
MTKGSSAGGIYWTAPTTMLVSFTFGVVLAAGHHFSYLSLDGMAVEKAKFQQQINLAIGTGFAFLVRHCLVLAVASSYWQLFSGTLVRDIHSVAVVDSLAGLLGNVQGIFSIARPSRKPGPGDDSHSVMAHASCGRGTPSNIVRSALAQHHIHSSKSARA